MLDSKYKNNSQLKTMLIKNAEVYQVGLSDLRIKNGVIAELGQLSPRTGEKYLDAEGGALLPGLHDHHIHFLSYAAALASINCSPAAVINGDGLGKLLQQQPAGSHWLRGIGYHESVAGEINCHWLDAHCPQRPLRIQHRSGRLWIFNSAGLAILKQAIEQQPISPLLSAESLSNGRFFDADRTLAKLLGRNLPATELASEKLASYGVTGFSDLTPSNNLDTFSTYENLISCNAIKQKVQLARCSSFYCQPSNMIIPGPVKIHLHENRLPDLYELIERIKSSHNANIPVAIHCVTEIELMFSLAALEEAGTIQGDRLEHASITPMHTLEVIKKLGVTVVSQPHFIQEKGETYLQEIDKLGHPNLYRCGTFFNWEIPIAAGSDAPFGSADPWSSMHAAVNRKTESGKIIGKEESVSPEQALSLYLGELSAPGKLRQIKTGMNADLCLMKFPWRQVRTRLTSNDVQITVSGGNPIYRKTEITIPHALKCHQ